VTRLARGTTTIKPISVVVYFFTLLLGTVAIFWAANVLPSAWTYGNLNRIADHVIAGDRFKPNALVEFATTAEEAANRDPLCNAATQRAAAIIHLRLLELDFEDAEQEEAIDPRLDALRVSIRRALSCSPADPFLWLVLYWVEMNRDGFRAHDVDYLQMSYALGPNEGWIALKRNGLVLAVFDQLPAKLRDKVVAEFANLLNSGFEGELVAILTGPGWKFRGRLLAKLKDVREDYRTDFAKALYHGGYDVVIPGVKLPDARPWD
jgi:hypothetical protein